MIRPSSPAFRALRFSVIAVILAVGVLFSIALILEQDVVGFVICLGTIVFWILTRKTSWTAGVSLIIVSFYTAIGIFRAEHIPLYIAAFLLSFAAWNLSLLTSRFSRVRDRPEEKSMLISYLIRLGEVTAVSGALTVIGILIDTRINFWIILLSVLFAAWMVSRLPRANR